MITKTGEALRTQALGTAGALAKTAAPGSSAKENEESRAALRKKLMLGGLGAAGLLGAGALAAHAAGVNPLDAVRAGGSTLRDALSNAGASAAGAAGSARDYAAELFNRAKDSFSGASPSGIGGDNINFFNGVDASAGPDMRTAIPEALGKVRSALINIRDAPRAIDFARNAAGDIPAYFGP